MMGAIKVALSLLLVGLAIFMIGATLMESRSKTALLYDPLGAEPLECSEFFKLLERRYNTKLLQTSYSYLSQAHPESALVIMGPTTVFTSKEISALEKFMSEGGVVILLADNDGTGSTLAFGDFRISKSPMRDFEHFDRRPDFVLIRNFDFHPIVRNVSSILTNYPAALVPSSGKKVNRVKGEIAYTSSRSFIDENKNGIPDADEPIGPLSIIALQNLGDGYFIAVADSGIFVNDMINRANNRQFAISLFDWSTRDGSKPVIFDLTHADHKPVHWLGIVEYFGNLKKEDMLLLMAFVFGLSLIGFTMGKVQRRGIEKEEPEVQTSEEGLGETWFFEVPELKKLTFADEIGRYKKMLKRFIKTNLNEPLMVYYEHFLNKCARGFKLKSPDPEVIAKRIDDEFPTHRSLKKTIRACEQVKKGVRDVKSPDVFRKIVKSMLELEKELGSG